MRADTPTGWTPCAEKMPPQNEDVFFLVEIPKASSYGLPVQIDLRGYFDGNLWWWRTMLDEKYFQPQYVIAWKPIKMNAESAEGSYNH